MIRIGSMSRRLGRGLAIASLASTPVAYAQSAPSTAPITGVAGDVATLKTELAEARALLAEQNRQLSEQKQRLDLLEQRLTGLAQAQSASNSGVSGAAPVAVASAGATGNEPVRVGQPPADSDRPPAVAVLDQQGSVVTRKGQLIAELGFDYTRADRNRAIFRGTGILPAILVGVFDINESRQDVLTTSGALRFGLTDRLEIGTRVPFIYRSDKQVTVPITDVNTGQTTTAIDSSVRGSSIGDVELTARYQINNGGRGAPFLIANLQATLPTGRNPFEVPRNSLGIALKPSTGAGFIGISPSITAILPSEPAVLFGTLGYTFNLPKDVNTRIGNTLVDRLMPGNQINISAGVGLSLNERTSLNFGYNHTWSFGTTTLTRFIDEKTGQPGDKQIRITGRDLQIGRFLFGVSQRFSESLLLNWAVEIGATEDAPDLRTSIRIPFYF